MKLLQYIRYFFLSISNRGFLFTIKLLLLEPYYERQLGIQTLAIENLEGMNVLDTDFQINHHYQGASYYVLHQVFEAMNQQVHHHSILDYGCGKGRPMIVAAREGFTNVKGIDLAEELCVIAKKNIEIIKADFPETSFTISHANATTYSDIDDVDVFFFFNPFGRSVINKVLENMRESIKRKHRTIYVIYVNPQFFDCFIHENFEIIYELRSKKYSEAMILRLN
jgi:SAM-dependent methyltransferase